MSTMATPVSARMATVRVPLPGSVVSGELAISERQYCCLRLERSDGIVGEAQVMTRGLPVEQVLQQLVLPRLKHDRPAGTQWLVALRNAGWSGPISRAVSLVELALMDAEAKHAAVPVWQHLGHHQPPSAHRIAVAIGYRSPATGHDDADVRQAEAAASLGATMVKLMGGANPVEVDAERVRRVAAALGDSCSVALDVNGGWAGEMAGDALKRLADAGATLVEDPWAYELGVVPATVPSGLDVALGEVLASPLEFAEMLRTQPMTIARPDCTLLGGPELFRRATMSADAARVPSFPHFWPEYHAQLLPAGAASLIECILPGAPWFGQESFIHGLPVLTDRGLSVSSEPGFGLSLDWTAINRLSPAGPRTIGM